MVFTAANKFGQSVLDHYATRRSSLHPILRTDLVNDKRDDNPFLGHRISKTLSASTTTVYNHTRSLEEMTKRMFEKHGLELRHAEDIIRNMVTLQKQTPQAIKNIMTGHLNPETYKRNATTALMSTRSVAEVSSNLCRMLSDAVLPSNVQIHPSHARRGQGDAESHTAPETKRSVNKGRVEQAREDAAAYVAYQLMLSHEMLVQVLPIRFNQTGTYITAHGHQAPEGGKMKSVEYVPVTYGIFLTYKDGFKTILPLDISLIGTLTTIFGISNADRKGEETAPWTWNNNELGELLQEKFEFCPVLHVRDAMLLLPVPYERKHTGREEPINMNYGNDAGFLAPRMIADSWHLTRRLRKGQKNSSAILPVATYEPTKHGLAVFDTKGKERFTKLRFIVERVRELGTGVLFDPGREPLIPHTILHLDEFLTQGQPWFSVDGDDADNMVDGVLSCGISYECTTPRQDGSPFCGLHKTRVERILGSSTVDEGCLEADYKVPNLKMQPPTTMKHRESLLKLYKHIKDNTWATDAEGWMVGIKDRATIPFETALVNYVDCESDLDTTFCAAFKYEGTSHPDRIRAAVLRHGVSPFVRYTATSIKKAYDSVSPQLPESPSDIRSRLFRDTNFREGSALVLQWGSTPLDSEALGRIMRERDDIQAKKRDVVLGCEVIDLCQLFKACTNANEANMDMKLSTIWHWLFDKNGTKQKWHNASWDATATMQIAIRLVGHAEVWLAPHA